MPEPAVQNVQRLRRVAAALTAGRAPDPEDAAWLADGLGEYLGTAARGGSLEDCLDLSPMPGETCWWNAEAVASRDAAICEMATRFYSGLTVAAAARQIEERGLRYATTAWRFDRDRETMPANYEKSAKEFLWQAFSSGAAMPLKRRQLETILAAGSRADAA